jgi:predicted PP-loop superfamily ATPase
MLPLGLDLTTKLQCATLLRIIEVFSSSSTTFIVMELMKENLSMRLKTEPSLKQEKIAEIVYQVILISPRFTST